MEDNTVYYKERIIQSPVILATAIAVWVYVAWDSVALYLQNRTDPFADKGDIIPVVAVGILLALILLWDVPMRTIIKPGEIIIRMGMLRTAFNEKRIVLENIKKCEVVRMSLLQSISRSGLRRPVGFISGGRRMGVMVETPQEKYVIGSREPGLLAAAIQKAAITTTGSERPPKKRKAKND